MTPALACAPTVEATTDTLHFARGLLGFPECRAFRLRAAERDGLYWLESLEHETLNFLIVDPFRFFPGYAVELGRADTFEIDARNAAELAVFAIVTLPRNGGAWTANLQGPVVINTRSGLGRQSVLGDARVGVRCPFDPRCAV